MNTTLIPNPTTSASGTDGAPAYEQTVPRSLVHRWSLSEVFLTGSHGTSDNGFVAAAQLPLSHAYFRDHPGSSGFFDPLNVLEAGRQAVTCAAHLHQDVPAATTFMVSSWSLRITDPAVLACGERPGELRIDGRVTDRKERGGHVRRLVFAMELALGGDRLGVLSMDVNCTPSEQYVLLRRMQRRSEIVTAFTLPAEPSGTPVPPAEVGRHDPLNVVLDDARVTPDGLTAVLSPRTFRNRSMYDHPYDHVPAMVFSEAARQCAVLLAGVRGAHRVIRLDGAFTRFAELDRPVGLTARQDAEGGPGDYWMTAEQDGGPVAEVAVTLG